MHTNEPQVLGPFEKWTATEASIYLSSRISIDALPIEVIEELAQLRKMVDELYYPMKPAEK